MEAKIEKLLSKLNIDYEKERHIQGHGYSYYFKLIGANYNLFTSCWGDYGLHFVYRRTKRSKLTFQKIIDYEKNLNRIEQILTLIIQYREEKRAK